MPTQQDSAFLDLASSDAPKAAGRSLDSLELGESALVGHPDALGPTVLRLMEMGLTPGAEVTLLRRAPFGDPLEVRLRGTRLCLRRADAAHFRVLSRRDTP